tara:strand:- start:60 stop:1019 length:960 start_codon:yes stop_codon:yes gene_type:complete
VFKLKIISTGIIFLLVIFFISVNFKLQFKESILVDIPSGSSSSIIANILYENNLILNPLLFKTYSRFTSSDNSFKAGEYFIDTPESINSLISKIVLGDFFYRKLTLLPGSSLEDVMKLRYLEGLKDDLGNEFKLSMKQKGIILEEGIFYPDTYYYLKGETFSSILIKSHQKWKENYENLWEQRRANLPYKRLMDAITLASIIEKEGLEKEKIAGVFLNRLEVGMKLQSDPTVIYSLGKKFDGDLKRKDLRVRNPYNTYRYKGLPPGPISLVSEESLKAALNPLETEYLYFVSMGNGYHKFSKTLSEHNKAVLKYQINAR